MVTSFNRLAAVRPHSDPHVEAPDPDIIMRRLPTSERVPAVMWLEFGGAISGNMNVSFQAARSIG